MALWSCEFHGGALDAARPHESDSSARTSGGTWEQMWAASKHDLFDIKMKDKSTNPRICETFETDPTAPLHPFRSFQRAVSERQVQHSVRYHVKGLLGTVRFLLEQELQLYDYDWLCTHRSFGTGFVLQYVFSAAHAKSLLVLSFRESGSEHAVMAWCRVQDVSFWIKGCFKALVLTPEMDQSWAVNLPPCKVPTWEIKP